MYTIGEFSRICMVTTKTLRHYDAAGILKPAAISDETGYRYYEVSQLRDMLLIQRLKEYGFSLEEIAGLMHALPHVLAARIQAKLEEQVLQLKHQKTLLKKMKNDLAKLEKGIGMMSELKTEVKIMETAPQTIASVRENIAIKDFDKLFGKAMKLVNENRMAVTGPPLAIYHCPEFDPESSDVEIGVPVKEAGSGTRILNGGTCAMAIHMGGYSNLGETYSAIAEWIDKNGYRIAAPPYERYLNSPGEVPEEKLMTEIYFPIEK
ncbi:MAG: MerR family transcriptional regulator [Christensenellaceae bacterium]|jgi:DNA-binding transcriptional MerR regulator